MAGSRAAQAATSSYVVLAEQLNRNEDGEFVSYKRGDSVELSDADASRLGVDAKLPRDRMVARASVPDTVSEPTPGSGADQASAATGDGGQGATGASGASGADAGATGATGADAGSGSVPGGGPARSDGTPTNAQ